MQQIRPSLTIGTNKARGWKYFKDNYFNLIYMIPVLVGIIAFTIIPMFTALVYSFCEMDLMDPTWTLPAPSLKYYIEAFTTRWDVMGYAYFVTLRYGLTVNVISFVGSYIVALILNQKLKGMGTFRILYYLPCLIPGLAGTLLWNGLTKETGYFNMLLINMGLQPFTWYSSNDTVFPTMIILSTWGFSGNMIMWLAQFKNIPKDLYEEAELSGAGYFHQLFHITIPMSTSMIFYLLIMNIIGTLQSFGYYALYVDNGRPADLNFIGVYIYEQAYEAYNISYACALSWILFGVIGIFTFFVFKSSNGWVYYAEEN